MHVTKYVIIFTVESSFDIALCKDPGLPGCYGESELELATFFFFFLLCFLCFLLFLALSCKDNTMVGVITVPTENHAD